MRKFKYDYYTVYVPGDMYIPENVNVDTEDMTKSEAESAVNAEIMRQLGLHAISEAEERSKVYAMPANWSARHVSGEIGNHLMVFRVCRKRNA